MFEQAWLSPRTVAGRWRSLSHAACLLSYRQRQGPFCGRVPETPLLPDKELGTIIFSPGLATLWVFVSRATPHTGTGEEFLAGSPPGLPSCADAAFSPLQYYEMSYGLNIEMHKQVSVSVSQLPVPAPLGSSLPTECMGSISLL